MEFRAQCRKKRYARGATGEAWGSLKELASSGLSIEEGVDLRINGLVNLVASRFQKLHPKHISLGFIKVLVMV